MIRENLIPALFITLCTLMISPLNADSDRGKKEQRFEQRRDSGKSAQQQKQFKQYNRYQKKDFRNKSKTLRTGKHKSNVKDHRKFDKQHNRHDRNKAYQRSKHSRDNRKDKYQKQRHYYNAPRHRDHRRHEVRHGRHLLLQTPRHRQFRNILVIRPHGHAYHGYGHYLHDHSAWRWLAFTAITLTLLDRLDEYAQREHETAQIAATTARVGEEIIWDTEDASGYVVTTREGTNRRGQTCREYQQSITVGGETEEAVGTACLQSDGSWKIVN